MTVEPDAVAEGRAAWQRLRERERATWDDWIHVGHALVVGRAQAMRIAQTNNPFGRRYAAAISAWLRQHDLDGIAPQERNVLLRVIENLPAIETWRATLDERLRRSLNHPGATWWRWRRATVVPTRRIVRNGGATRGRFRDRGRAVYWPQAAIARAADAIYEARSTDCVVMARIALEAAVRGSADIEELLADRPSERPLRPARPRAEAQVSAAP